MPSLPGIVAPVVHSSMRVLVLTYALPPMHVQMTPVLLKPLAALTRLGIAADVVTVRDFPPILPRGHDLLAYADGIFENKIFVDDARKEKSWTLRSGELFKLPDLMAAYSRRTLAALLDLDLNRYDAILTWSPFHSINQVMLELKKERPRVKWIAQFSDPWARNPLERHWTTNLWNNHFERRTIPSANAIIHSSHYSMKLMASGLDRAEQRKFRVIGHCYDRSLYGDRRARAPASLLIRHVGTLFGRRTPEPLFRALVSLLARRPELAKGLELELVGPIERRMLASDAAKRLPKGLVRHVPSVGYVKSLKYMAEADLLVLIEADVKSNLFLPSKLADYVGSDTPILGLVPPGASKDFVESLKCWHADPGDVEKISQSLELALDHIKMTPNAPWCDDEFSRSLSGEAVAREYRSVIERVIA
jgi:glycosyltransferase involved in cell wall biosynthesis